MSSSYTTLEQIFSDINKSINEKICGINFLGIGGTWKLFATKSAADRNRLTRELEHE